MNNREVPLLCQDNTHISYHTVTMLVHMNVEPHSFGLGGASPKNQKNKTGQEFVLIDFSYHMQLQVNGST